MILHVLNVKETYFMLIQVLLEVPAYPKPNALKTISKSTGKSVWNPINALIITTCIIMREHVRRNNVVVVNSG